MVSVVAIAVGASIQAAIDVSPAGTVFQLGAGTYRGQQFHPKSNDEFIGDSGGSTVLSGAVVLNQWNASGHYWVRRSLPASVTGHGQVGINPLARKLNDLFVDNVLYKRVAGLSQVAAGTWYFDPITNSAYIADDPTGRTVEYSVTPTLTGDSRATGVVVQHLTIEKYATDAQTGPIHGARGWRIVDVSSAQNHGAGLVIGASTIVQGGHYVDNGQLGIGATKADGARVIGTEIARNNYAGYDPDWEAGGLKMVLSSGVVISGNNVHDNHGQGLWSDIGDSNFTYANNSVSHNDGNGIMYEISYGSTVIRDNTVTCNGGFQIFISNSQGVEVSGNTVAVGATMSRIRGGISMVYIDRGSGRQGPYDTKDNDVHSNVITHLGGGSDGFWIYYNDAIAATWHNRWDENIYRVSNANIPYWHFGRSDYLWREVTDRAGFEQHGTMTVVPKQAGDQCQPAEYNQSGRNG